MQIYRKKNTEFVNFVTYLTLFLYICPYLSRKRGDYESTESGIELVRSCSEELGVGASYMFVCGFAVLEIAVLPIGETVGDVIQYKERHPMDASPYYYAYTRGLPSCTQHSEVALVTPLSILLSGGEELVCLFRELFCYRSET